jgi:hypothetical protein
MNEREKTETFNADRELALGLEAAASCKLAQNSGSPAARKLFFQSAHKTTEAAMLLTS